MAAARQKEMKDSATVVATTTLAVACRSEVVGGVGHSELLFYGVRDLEGPVWRVSG